MFVYVTIIILLWILLWNSCICHKYPALVGLYFWEKERKTICSKHDNLSISWFDLIQIHFFKFLALYSFNNLSSFCDRFHCALFMCVPNSLWPLLFLSQTQNCLWEGFPLHPLVNIRFLDYLIGLGLQQW